MMLVASEMHVGESVGQFIWRMAAERILNEQYTDEIAVAVAESLALKMPLKKFFPWKTMLTWVIDRALPEYGMLALRRMLEVAKLAEPGDPYFHIPGIDPVRSEVDIEPLDPEGNG